ncbi:MAG: TolA-binding protein [Myxococcota bacterium]|jgi:TolA-binding protein
MIGWSQWKKAFDSWEVATAEYLETIMTSPVFLIPSGAALSSAMKARGKINDAMTSAWGRAGLPTKRDQERTLHALNQLQSQLMDMEERLEDMQRVPGTSQKNA